jgi:hypothetical protein
MATQTTTSVEPTKTVSTETILKQIETYKNELINLENEIILKYNNLKNETPLVKKLGIAGICLPAWIIILIVLIYLSEKDINTDKIRILPCILFIAHTILAIYAFDKLRKKIEESHDYNMLLGNYKYNTSRTELNKLYDTIKIDKPQIISDLHKNEFLTKYPNNFFEDKFYHIKEGNLAFGIIGIIISIFLIFLVMVDIYHLFYPEDINNRTVTVYHWDRTKGVSERLPDMTQKEYKNFAIESILKATEKRNPELAAAMRSSHSKPDTRPNDNGYIDIGVEVDDVAPFTNKNIK